MADKSTEQLKQFQVPQAPQPVMYVTDPRNNFTFLSMHPNTVILPLEPKVELNRYDVLSQSNSEQFSYQDFKDVFPDYEIPLKYTESPTNLAIDINSFKLQTDAKDGSVYYTVSLTFDDSTEAVQYEYRIGTS